MSDRTKRGSLKLLRQLLALCAMVALLAASSGWTYEQVGRSRDRKVFPPRVGLAVDVGGRSINLYCSGSGSPTVVLETGKGSPGYAWVLVQPKIARFTRACWYDRAGEGWSDPPPAPPTAETFTNDLHAVLVRAEIPPPYVLVGWSIGGEIVRVFTAKFPADVAGLVLVDSDHPDEKPSRSETSPFNLMPSSERRFVCAAWPLMDHFGILRLMGVFRPKHAPAELSPEEQRVYGMLRSQRVSFETAAAARCEDTHGGVTTPTGSGEPEIDDAARTAGNVGQRPLVVLTAESYYVPLDPIQAQEAAAFHYVWVNKLQTALSLLSARGKQWIVQNSDHEILFHAPDTVVDAVQDVLAQIHSTNSTTSAR